MIDSSWVLIKLKTQSQNSAKADLLDIFDVLKDLSPTQDINNVNETSNRTNLLSYLSKQAEICGVKSPDVIAQQIYFMACNAAMQQQANPDSNALYHAKQAAFALIEAQTKAAWLHQTHQYLRIKPVAYSFATAVFSVAFVFSAMGYQALHPHRSISNTYLAEAEEANTAQNGDLANPSDTADMYAKIEKMRDGRCHYIEVLQLPEAQQGLYLQNVIAGQVSNKINDQRVARELMEKVSCDYTPMLMKNSAG